MINIPWIINLFSLWMMKYVMKNLLFDDHVDKREIFRLSVCSCFDRNLMGNSFCESCDIELQGLYPQRRRYQFNNKSWFYGIYIMLHNIKIPYAIQKTMSETLCVSNCVNRIISRYGAILCKIYGISLFIYSISSGLDHFWFISNIGACLISIETVSWLMPWKELKGVSVTKSRVLLFIPKDWWGISREPNVVIQSSESCILSAKLQLRQKCTYEKQ